MLLALVFISVSCSSDDDDSSSSSGYIQIDGGTKYKITQSQIVGLNADGVDNDQSYYAINLISSVSTTDVKTTSLALFFPYDSSIDGTYSISSDTKVLNSWLSSFSEFDGTTLTSNSDLSSGTCTIKKSGDNFTISFSITPEDGRVITGSFSGQPTSFTRRLLRIIYLI